VRRAGVTLPLFSLRGERDWGVGEIPDLGSFAPWARDAGLSVVQLLPVSEPSLGQSSPYAALTAFAIDPAFASLAEMEDFRTAGGEEALPSAARKALAKARAAKEVRWEQVRIAKEAALELAYRSFAERERSPGSARARQLAEFSRREGGWLGDYALFRALKQAHGGVSWTDWPSAVRDREPAALERAREKHRERVRYYEWLQWQLDRQWHAARAVSEKAGVTLMGDLPFMVATDSADVWARQGEFRIDASVGVPPDAFSADGQDWGLPVYRWSVMAKNGYAWMRDRARRAAELFGLYRVDHVVGLYRTYFRPLDGGERAFVPSEVGDQLALGEAVMTILKRGGGDDAGADHVIAEDLGVVPEFVRESLTALGVPGYRVLRWEKDGEAYRDPRTFPALSVATTGTHDTDSLADWWETLPSVERTSLLALPDLAPLWAKAPVDFDDAVRDALLALAYHAGSDLVLVPFPDLFGLRDRINTPATVNDVNWTWRMPRSIALLRADRAAAKRLAGLARESRRR
jgi:4-alpha-glucanotransferase